MEQDSIEREIHVDAAPEVVFDVVSDPAHVRAWWPDEADYPAEVVVIRRASSAIAPRATSSAAAASGNTQSAPVEARAGATGVAATATTR